MRQRKIQYLVITGIAVLLCTALVFLGCEEAGTALASAPEVPANFAAVPGAGQVVLTWTASENVIVTGYKIRQTVDENTTEIPVNDRGTATYTVTGLSAGKSYSFTIASVAGSIESAQSEPVTATPTSVLSAPSVTAAPADGQITLSWNAVAGATSYRVYQGTSDNKVQDITEGTTAVITGLTNDQAYKFWVAAVNSSGSKLSAEITATPSSLAAPAGLTATPGGEQVALAWSAVAGADSYKVYRDGTALAAVITATQYTVTGLTADTSYSFTVSAVNSGGEGAQSTAVTATPAAALAAVEGLSASAGINEVVLRWNASADMSVTSYRIFQTVDDSTTSYMVVGRTTVEYTARSLVAGKVHSFTIAALASGTNSSQSDPVTATPTPPPLRGMFTATAGVEYVTLRWIASLAVSGVTCYKIRQTVDSITTEIPVNDRTTRTYNVIGLSAGKSYTYTIATVAGSLEGRESAGTSAAVPTPAVPADLTAVGQDTQVVLTWTASTNAGVTGYKIRQTVDSTDTEIDVSGMTTASRTVTGLTNGKQYSFTIAAVAGSTESAQSTAVTATPLGTPSVTATPADRQVTLSWSAVSGASSYKIYQGTNTNEILTDSTITAISTVVSGLNNDQEYSFWVSAVNSSGSIQSMVIKATPSAPTMVPAGTPTLTATAGVNQVRLSWTGVDGASSYRVYQNGSALSPDVSDGTSYTVSTLTAGTQYSFTVSAVNSVGAGTQSTAATATPTPAAAAGLSATAGVGQAALTWTASADTAVTGYKIRQTVDGTETEIDVSGMTTASHTVTGLTNGKQYSFTIAAVAGAGNTESVQSSAVMATPTPAAVAGLSATAGVEQLALTWTASADTAVTGYKIRQTVIGRNTEIDVSGRTTAAYTIINAFAGERHIVTIAAVAGSAESVPSAEVTAGVPTPAIPTGVTATAGVEQVELNWSASGNEGIGGYKIEQTVDTSTSEIVVNGGTPTTYTVRSLTVGKNYTFKVKAVAGATESAYSAATSAAVPNPAVPANLAATGKDTQVELTWTASSNAGITGYKIRQTVDGTETEIAVSGRTAASHTVTGLTNRKQYSFTIAAVAGSLESAQSSAITTTPDAVGIPQNVRAAISEDTAGTAGSRQQVVLSWDAVTNAASYKIYQDSTALTTSPATLTATNYTVSSLADGQNYSFTVSAVDGSSQESTQSAAVATCNFTDADGDGLIEICTLDHLARISTARGGNYELVRNLDFSSQHSYAPSSTNWTNKTWRPVDNAAPSASTNVVAHGSALNPGWEPIGIDGIDLTDDAFTGNFNGRGYRIENLYARGQNACLFIKIDSSSTVRNLHVDANLYGNFNSTSEIGAITSNNWGVIIASSSSGTANGLAGRNDSVGGVAASSLGTIAASYSTMSVNGGGGTNAQDWVGGLVSQNYGHVAASYATGAVNGGSGNNIAGGLVGDNNSTIIASYATGPVLNYNWGGNLVYNRGSSTATESYGYGTTKGSGGNAGGEKALTAGATGDGGAGTSWRTNVWDFGTSSQSPRLKWVTGYNSSNNTFTCDASLLPAGQSCGGIIPGQPARE